MAGTLAGRVYPHVYSTPTRTDLHGFLCDAVVASGGQLLYVSEPTRSPVYLGIQTQNLERIGVLAYPFRANHRLIRNRPQDEHRMQIRYGGEASWDVDHPLGIDVAGIDTTLTLGLHLEAGVFVGLDPRAYDPLPMGISVEFKDSHVTAAIASTWYVFERDNLSGRKRANPRAPAGLETIVMFTPDRLVDFVRFERTARDLALDPALRFVAAIDAAQKTPSSSSSSISTHDLEVQFEMTSAEILTMISQANRLSTAVRGGVAEFHLGKQLNDDVDVSSVVPIDKDGAHDFDVTMMSGTLVSVECKNASPRRYANGDIKVEVQKTRATRDDPAGRLYRLDQFDVVAACLKGPTGRWEFRFRRAGQLLHHDRYPDRLAPLQRVTDEWSPNLRGAL